MGCLPESGGCERQRTDPFVDHLNWVEKTDYQHVACLDVTYRNSPQPEALYFDQGSGQELVIERKTLVWPPDYAAGHKRDHFIADRLAEGLGELTSDGPYCIALELGAVGKPDELSEFSQQIIETVQKRFHEVQNGKTIGSQAIGRRWSFFREEAGLRAFEGNPEYGLMVRWDMASGSEASRLNLSPGLLAAVSQLFSSCVLKFQDYLGARRIVVIDQYGDIRYNGDWWWASVFEAVPPPIEISEMWSGTFDWLDETQQGWMFDKLYPITTRPHLTLLPQ